MNTSDFKINYFLLCGYVDHSTVATGQHKLNFIDVFDQLATELKTPANTAVQGKYVVLNFTAKTNERISVDFKIKKDGIYIDKSKLIYVQPTEKNQRHTVITDLSSKITLEKNTKYLIEAYIEGELIDTTDLTIK